MNSEEYDTVPDEKELKVGEEEPLEIKDYTCVNDWEQLINNIEIPLIKWNISESQEKAMKATKLKIFTGPPLPDDSSPKSTKLLSEEFTFRITFFYPA